MSVIKCGFEIEITDDKAFIEKVARYMKTKPELVIYDDISNFILVCFLKGFRENKIFDDFSYDSGNSHQIRTDNQIADIARVRGIETDGGFYTSIDCDKIVEVADKMYAETFATFTKKDVVVESVKARKERQVQEMSVRK